MKVCTDVETGLARIFGVGNLRPCREATAINTLTSALPFALGAMADSGAGTFTMSGQGGVTVNGNVVVNSNTDNGLCDVALTLGGIGSLSATAIEVRDPPGAADAWEDCGIGSFSPQPINSFSNPPLLDPLCPNPSDPSSCLPFPGNPGCPAPANCNSTTIEAPGDTIWPGVYDEIIVNSGTLTMMPGLYVFRGTGGGSKFEINGGNVVGNGVTLYFACQDYPATCGGGDTVSYLSLGENPVTCTPPSPPSCTPSPPARATFTAPPPGSYTDERVPGMAIFFDRNAPQSSSGPPGVGIFGDASLNVTGTIYGRSVLFQTTSGGATTLNSAVIVDKFEHSGSGDLTVTYTEDENVKVTGGIALIT